MVVTKALASVKRENTLKSLVANIVLKVVRASTAPRRYCADTGDLGAKQIA